MAFLKWTDKYCDYVLYGEINDLYLYVLYDKTTFRIKLYNSIVEKDITFICANYPLGDLYDTPKPEYIVIEIKNILHNMHPYYDEQFEIDQKIGKWSRLGYDMILFAEKLLDYNINTDNNKDFIDILFDQVETINKLKIELKKYDNIVENTDDIIKLVCKNAKIVNTLKGKDVLSLVDEINEIPEEKKDV